HHRVRAPAHVIRQYHDMRHRGLEIDHQLVFRRCLHRQIAGFLPFEDAIHVTSSEAVLVNPIRSISDEAASGREVALKVYRRQLVPRCEGNDKIAIVPSVLLSGTADHAVFQTWVGAFRQELAQSGWIIGRNVRIETRWAGSKADDIRRYAQELVALAPDVILAHGGSTVRPLLQSTRSIPIVFTIVTDPVG